MSAFGPKRTSLVALHMSAFGGKADMTLCGCLLSWSLLGVKRTCVAALHESAYDPKRSAVRFCRPVIGRRSTRKPRARLSPRRRGLLGLLPARDDHLVQSWVSPYPAGLPHLNIQNDWAVAQSLPRRTNQAGCVSNWAKVQLLGSTPK